MEVLSIDSLTTGYRHRGEMRKVTDNLSLQFSRGEVVSLLGPNGAGKSTLLKTLSGKLPPIGGEIRIEGRPLHDYTPQYLAKKVAVVLTERPGVVSMTVREMVEMGRSPYTGFTGKLSPEDKAIAGEAMRVTGILYLHDRAVSTLSDGERQKVMIAKAIAQDTPIILLDEPSAFLDYPSKVELMLLLRYLAGTKNTLIILSTHDLNIALELSDKLLLVDKNIGTAFASPSELAENGRLREFFSSDAVILDGLTFQINRDFRVAAENL